MEENLLKRCLKGVQGGDHTPGGGRICLRVTEVHLTVGNSWGGVSRTRSDKTRGKEKTYI